MYRLESHTQIFFKLSLGLGLLVSACTPDSEVSNFKPTPPPSATLSKTGSPPEVLSCMQSIQFYKNLPADEFARRHQEILNMLEQIERQGVELPNDHFVQAELLRAQVFIDSDPEQALNILKNLLASPQLQTMKKSNARDRTRYLAIASLTVETNMKLVQKTYLERNYSKVIEILKDLPQVLPDSASVCVIVANTFVALAESREDPILSSADRKKFQEAALEAFNQSLSPLREGLTVSQQTESQYQANRLRENLSWGIQPQSSRNSVFYSQNFSSVGWTSSQSAELKGLADASDLVLEESPQMSASEEFWKRSEFHRQAFALLWKFRDLNDVDDLNRALAYFENAEDQKGNPRERQRLEDLRSLKVHFDADLWAKFDAEYLIGSWRTLMSQFGDVLSLAEHHEYGTKERRELVKASFVQLIQMIQSASNENISVRRDRYPSAYLMLRHLSLRIQAWRPTSLSFQGLRENMREQVEKKFQDPSYRIDLRFFKP